MVIEFGPLGRPHATNRTYSWMVYFLDGIIVRVRAYLDSAMVAPNDSNLNCGGHSLLGAKPTCIARSPVAFA
jgi:hypothetical protein